MEGTLRWVAKLSEGECQHNLVWWCTGELRRNGRNVVITAGYRRVEFLEVKLLNKREAGTTGKC